MSRRTERIASVLQAEVSRVLREEARDPRLAPISITDVRVNPDLSVAILRYVPLGGQASPGMEGALAEMARRFRGPVGRVLGTRHAPELRFELDRNFEHADRINRILSNLPPPADRAEGAGEQAAAGDDGEAR